MVNAENITVTFRTGLFKSKLKALENFSINIKKGDIFALLGPNGAGKSTAMYCFLGLIKPNKGKIKVFDEVPAPGSDIFNKISYLPEEPHYHQYLTVIEALKFYTGLYLKKTDESEIDDVLEKLSLTKFKNLKIQHCSKGMKQKVGIGVCILSKPELLFLDEPTRGLDPLIVKEFRDILLDMNKKGTTIILNSHILSEVELMCNHVAIINKGKVLKQDSLSAFVKFDEEKYYVEFQASSNIPVFINIQNKTNEIIKGEFESKNISEFMKYIMKNNLKIYQCNLKKISLEDTLYKYLKQSEK